MKPPARDSEQAGKDLTALLEGCKVKNVTFCPGDDSHNAHVNVEFTDGQVLEMQHTFYGLMVEVLRPRDEGDERDVHDYHQQPEGLM